MTASGFENGDATWMCEIPCIRLLNFGAAHLWKHLCLRGTLSKSRRQGVAWKVDHSFGDFSPWLGMHPSTCRWSPCTPGGPCVPSLQIRDIVNPMGSHASNLSFSITIFHSHIVLTVSDSTSRRVNNISPLDLQQMASPTLHHHFQLGFFESLLGYYELTQTGWCKAQNCRCI